MSMNIFAHACARAHIPGESARLPSHMLARKSMHMHAHKSSKMSVYMSTLPCWGFVAAPPAKAPACTHAHTHQALAQVEMRH